MEQGELTRIFCARPQNFAWFLGAGASATAGLPTAHDVIWYLKRRYYCAEENQSISRQDVQLTTVRARIQAYMDSKGFPNEGAPGEYATYFEKIFGTDKERQRRFLSAFLSEDRVTLSVGNRVLAALMTSGLTRVVFTTNFDSVLEKAVAEVSGRSLAAYHLEGARSARRALDNEEFPLYCKLHGDFRHDSLKNLPVDLAAQNEELSQCFVNASTRLGLIIAGYSGRDESVTALFRSVLDSSNPFPHGLLWTGLKGQSVPANVLRLIDEAREAGVIAHYVEIETFDSLMLRLWRNLPDNSPTLDRALRKTGFATVSIPQATPGKRSPIVRMNALPILALPSRCQQVSFDQPKEWSDLRAAERNAEGRLILTKASSVWCWGTPSLIRSQFKDVRSIEAVNISAQLSALDNHMHCKGFLQSALCRALANGKPLLCRTTRVASYLITDRHAEDHAPLQALIRQTGTPFGKIAGMLTLPTEKYPNRDQIFYAEALRVSIDTRAGRHWLLLTPDLWIWPTRARSHAVDFLDKRRSGRFNAQYNALLDAWLSVILSGSNDPIVKISAFDAGSDAENPSFALGARTSYARRVSI